MFHSSDSDTMEKQILIFEVIPQTTPVSKILGFFCFFRKFDPYFDLIAIFYC